MKKTKSYLAYLFALVPAASAGLYLLLMIWTSDLKYEPGKFHFITPLGQQDVTEFSVVWILCAAATFFVWGLCGRASARCRVGIFKITLAANAIPLLATVLYIIFSIAGNADAAAVCTIGYGMFLIPGNFIYSLVPLNYIEVIINILLTVGTFAVGYATGAGGNKKK